MSQKALIVLVDGMRPDALALTGHPLFERLKSECAYSLNAQTVFPSVTLPCHMSLFHSVTPQRHGILTNLYVPQVRPVKGLFDTLRLFKKSCAMFYNWEELRDLSRPDALAFSTFASGHVFGYENANPMVTDACIDCISQYAPDCAFLYLGFTDAAGHNHGWMSEEYLDSIRESFDCITRVLDMLPQNYTFFLTADHGGHDRAHGTEMAEDMTIPLFIKGQDFKAGSEIADANIMDIAPTVVKLLGVPRDDDWEGKEMI